MTWAVGLGRASTSFLSPTQSPSLHHLSSLNVEQYRSTFSFPEEKGTEEKGSVYDGYRRDSASTAAAGGRQDGGGGPGSASTGKGVLKRGTACLFCRKRKLKCTGANPCPTCVKHNMECTYDEPVKSPNSRVKLLEEKIAGLENILTAQVGPSAHSFHPNREQQRDRSATFPYPSKKPPPTSHVDEQKEFSLALQELFRVDFHADGSRMHTSGAGQTGLSFLQDWNPPSVPQSSRLQTNPSSPDFFPTYGRFPPVSSTHQPMYQAPPPPSDQSFWNLTGASTDLSSSSVAIPNFTDPSSSSLLDLNNLYVSPPSSSRPDFGLLGFDPTLSSFQSLPHPPAVPLPAVATVPTWSPPQMKVPGGGGSGHTVDWGDGTVLPEGMREHLLKLFFERRRQFGFVMHVGRFWSSIDRPPEGRPAPALLFAMYACIARFSPNPHIQALEDTFLTLALRNFEIGFASYQDQRLVQLIQASVMLTVYHYSQSRYVDGWMQGGASVDLAQACRLHRLSAKEISFDMQCFADGVAVPGNVAAWPPRALPPPKDGIELGERLWAFWEASLLDHIGAIAVGRAPRLDPSQIETPLPRPLEDYERGVLQPTEMRCLYKPLSAAYTCPPPDTLGGIVLESMVLLAATANLSDHFIVPSLQDDYDAQPFVPPGRYSTPSSSGSPESPFSLSVSLSSDINTTLQSDPISDLTTTPSPATKPLPEEWVRAEKTLLQFVEQLPSRYRDPSRPQRGGIPPWQSDHGIHPDQGTYDGPRDSNNKIGILPVVFSVHVTLCTAFLLLYTEAAKFDPRFRIKATQAASSAVQLIQIVVDVDFGQLDICLIVLWNTQARVILDEIKTLRREGQMERAASLTAEVDVLMLAMKRMGQLWAYGVDLAEQLERGDGEV